MRGGVWYYDFGIRESLGWFDDPVYLQSIADEKALFDKQLNVPHKSEADVLYVWSQESYYYLKPQSTPISSNVIDHSIEEALRSGTVGDHIYDFDLDKVNLDQYKAVIFMNSYVLSSEQRKFIREKVAQNGRTLIYNYLTGVTDGETIGLLLTEKLSGVKLALQNATGTANAPFHRPGIGVYLQRRRRALCGHYRSADRTVGDTRGTPGRGRGPQKFSNPHGGIRHATGQRHRRIP